MKIFLSYGHDNASEALVLRIKTDLAHLGHEVWLDRERIEFGDDWRREVTEGIIESDHVLAFLSEHSTRDPGVCRDEIAIALGAGKAYVFTILVQPEVDVSLPISVSHLQWLDMHDWQARQQADTDAFDVWYAERFAQICAVIDHPDNQRFAGEISQLEEYLLPLDCTPDINSRLPGFTGRQWLLDEINTWREGDRSSRIFCLSGGPGMGKSAVVAWLAHSNKAQVIAAQFCRYNSPERRDPTRVIRSIAFQLATRLPDYRRHLLNQPEIKDLDRKNPVDLFDYLLANPLRYAINGNRPRQLIVIDALDETLQNGQSELTELIASQLSKLPDWLGWVVTSRPESAIRGQLEQFGLHEISADDPRNQEDVETYIQHWLSTLGLEQTDLIHAQQQILTAAQGNFLYVRQLQAAVQQNIIDIKQLNDLPKGLSALYLREFKYRYPDTHHYEQELLPVLEILVASSRPIPTSDIETLLNYTKRQRAKVLERLGSYLTVTEQGVALFHKSLQDWLLDENSVGADYFVEIDNGHQVLGKVLWEQFTQTEDLVSCLDSYMALELPEQLKHWSDEALLKVIDQEAVEQYSENIEELIDLRTLPYLKHDQQESWGWLGVRLSELCYGLEHPNTAINLRNIASLTFYTDTEEYYKAEFTIWRALNIIEKNLAINNQDIAHQLYLLNLLAQFLEFTWGSKAEELNRRVLIIIDESLGSKHHIYAVFLHRLADFCDENSAEFCYREAIKIIENTLESEHVLLIACLVKLADHLCYNKKSDIAAENYYCRALDITEKIFGENHLETVTQLINLAEFLEYKKEYIEAEKYYRRALVIAEKIFGKNHHKITRPLNKLASFHTRKKEYSEAEFLYRRLLDIIEKNLGSDHGETSIYLRSLGDLYREKNEHEKSIPLYRESLRIKRKWFGENAFETRAHISYLARYLNHLGDTQESEKLYRQELAICEKYLGLQNPETHGSMKEFGNFLRGIARYDESEKILRGVVELQEKLIQIVRHGFNDDFPSIELDLSDSLFSLGLTLEHNGELEEVKNLYQKALSINIKEFGENDPETRLIQERIASL